MRSAGEGRVRGRTRWARKLVVHAVRRAPAQVRALLFLRKVPVISATPVRQGAVRVHGRCARAGWGGTLGNRTKGSARLKVRRTGPGFGRVVEPVGQAFCRGSPWWVVPAGERNPSGAPGVPTDGTREPVGGRAGPAAGTGCRERAGSDDGRWAG